MIFSFFPDDGERFATGRAALGTEPPDLILRGGTYLNVFTGEVLPGDLWIKGRFIARITTETCAFETKVVDVGGKFLAPGFVEGHIHVESSLADPGHFAEAALNCGVTSIFTDFHEVGAIAGEPGLREMLEAIRGTDLKVLFMTPMELPFLPEVQHTLSTLTQVEALTLLQEADTVGLAEVNGHEIATFLREGRPSDLSLLTHAVRNRRTPEGHLFHIRGPELDACLAVGLSSDHEPRRQDEVAEKIRKGLFVMLRNGTIAREVETLVEVIPREHLPADRVGLVTDDILVTHMTPESYMLRKVRLAIQAGISVPDALRMVSWNVAEHYRLGELIGALRPGAYADILVFDSPESLKLEGVFASGKPVGGYGISSQTPEDRPLRHTYSPRLSRTILRSPITEAELRYLPEDFSQASAAIRSIELEESTRFTRLVETQVPVRSGDVDLSASEENLFYLICANRQHDELLGKAFLRNYGLREGGIAVSQAHDHHSIIALGRRKSDLIQAANRVIELQGGIVLVQGGVISAELPLPVAGLMSDLPLDETKARIEDIERRLRAGGATWNQPLFFLFWLGMEVAPFFRITDRGLFDTEERRLVSCFARETSHA
ncbi:MAG: adenine deaminase C-terminal domain-containing protein [Rectinemataceae bacterium]|nr:adenine deaminase C-terminal domain-containing protein [Rectinemataceae bacterium]